MSSLLPKHKKLLTDSARGEWYGPCPSCGGMAVAHPVSHESYCLLSFCDNGGLDPEACVFCACPDCHKTDCDCREGARYE